LTRRSRPIAPDELALWHQVVRDAQPLRPEPRVETASEEPPPPQPRPTVAAPAPPPPPIRPSRRLDPTGPVDLDRRTWLRLRRGLYPIDARLDLHGLTQAEAHARLTAFLATAHARGNRCVLVITGRGARHGGTLRALTPRWLDEHPSRPHVLAFAQAQLHHGGEGALYVLLRRRALAPDRIRR
jgi:DNA-nicking Smr family endonuclease